MPALAAANSCVLSVFDNLFNLLTCASVTISRCALSGNSAYSGAPGDFAQLVEGGGIYNESGTVIISDSDLTGNGAVYGGGIFNSGMLTIGYYSSVTGNSASVGPDVDNGGVLYLQGGSTIGVLEGNSAISIP